MTTTTPEIEVRSGFVDVGGAELWFEQRGSGPDVFLIAGLSDPVEAWELQLAGLSDRYRVTAFDNRGAGRSSKRREKRPHDVTTDLTPKG